MFKLNTTKIKSINQRNNNNNNNTYLYSALSCCSKNNQEKICFHKLFKMTEIFRNLQAIDRNSIPQCCCCEPSMYQEEETFLQDFLLILKRTHFLLFL